MWTQELLKLSRHLEELKEMAISELYSLIGTDHGFGCITVVANASRVNVDFYHAMKEIQGI